MNPIHRRRISDGNFGPAVLRETVNVPIATDNIICVACRTPLGLTPYVIVSHPERKGLLAFACQDHAGQAMDIIGSALGMDPKNRDVKLPEPGAN
jgi:hypothetical protein